MTIYQYVPARITDLTKNEKWCLVGITLMGLLLRLAYCWDKPYLGDEVGTLMFIKKEFSYLLSHFETWLGMNYFIALEKAMANLVGENAFGLRLVPMTAGIVTIPLTARLPMNFTSHRTALVAAALIALNPYMIMYSGTIRAYSLLTALSLGMLILFVRWLDSPSFKRGAAVGVISYLLILTHPNGVYSFACLFVAMAAEMMDPSRRQAFLRKIPSILVPLSVSMILILISYWRIFPEMLRFGAVWHDTPPTGISDFPYAFSLYFSDGFYGWLSAFCFLSGLLLAYKKTKPVMLLAPCIFLPILLMSLQGTATFPWAYARFVIFILPVIIVFMAEGIDDFTNRYFPAHASRLSALATLILVLSWIPRAQAIMEESVEYPWHHAVAFLQDHVQPGDVVLGNAFEDVFHFTPYFKLSGAVMPRRLNKNTLANRTLESDSATLFFICSAHPIKTLSKTIDFGKIQIIVYEPSGCGDALERLRKDLQDTVSNGEELDPEFAFLYKNIWEINNRLGTGGDTDNFYYYNLWIKCFELTERQRGIPFNLQKWEARNFLKGLK